MAIELNKVVSVRGRRILVMADEVAAQTKFQDSLLLEPSNSAHEFIWVREDALAELRRQHGAVPVYGLWQTLLASRAVDLTARLSLFEDGVDRGSYLICENGRAIESGRYVANQIPVSTGARYSEGVLVSLDPAHLVLPKVTAKVTSEIIAVKRRANVLAGAASVIGIAISAGAGFLVDQYLSNKAERRDKEIARLNTETVRLQSQVDILKTQVYEFDPSVRDSMVVALSRFAEVTEQVNSSFTYVPNKEPSNVIELELPTVPEGLSFPIEAAAQPGARPKIRLSADGISDASLNPLLLADRPETQSLIRATEVGKGAP